MEIRHKILGHSDSALNTLLHGLPRRAGRNILPPPVTRLFQQSQTKKKGGQDLPDDIGSFIIKESSTTFFLNGHTARNMKEVGQRDSLFLKNGVMYINTTLKEGEGNPFVHLQPNTSACSISFHMRLDSCRSTRCACQIQPCHSANQKGV